MVEGLFSSAAHVAEFAGGKNGMAAVAAAESRLPWQGLVDPGRRTGSTLRTACAVQRGEVPALRGRIDERRARARPRPAGGRRGPRPICAFRPRIREGPRPPLGGAGLGGLGAVSRLRWTAGTRLSPRRHGRGSRRRGLRAGLQVLAGRSPGRWWCAGAQQRQGGHAAGRHAGLARRAELADVAETWAAATINCLKVEDEEIHQGGGGADHHRSCLGQVVGEVGGMFGPGHQIAELVQKKIPRTRSGDESTSAAARCRSALSFKRGGQPAVLNKLAATTLM